MKIHACTQGSTEWHSLRCGIPTASQFDELVTPKWAVKETAGRDEYVLRKVAERVMGFTEESLNSFAMGQGTLLEAEAIPFFEGVFGTEIQRVGFCTTDDARVGCSPDGLIGDDGGIEVKCPTPHVHLSYLMAGVVPKQYLAQVHGCMLVTGRPRWTFFSYNRYFPPLVVHVERDEAIQTALRTALDRFLSDFDTAHAKVQVLIAQNGGAA